MSPGSPGSVCNSARIGVMPMPPAISSTLRRLRRAAVIAPYGPSATTRAPGREPGQRRAVLAEVLDRDPQPVRAWTPPTASTGWRPTTGRGSGSASRKNWPASARSSSRCRPVTTTETTPGRLGHDLLHPQPVPDGLADRGEEPVPERWRRRRPR